jgi:hypothetical protein
VSWAKLVLRLTPEQCITLEGLLTERGFLFLKAK